MLGTPDGNKSGKKEIDTAQILLASISEPGKFYSIFFAQPRPPSFRTQPCTRPPLYHLTTHAAPMRQRLAAFPPSCGLDSARDGSSCASTSSRSRNDMQVSGTLKARALNAARHRMPRVCCPRWLALLTP